MKWIFVFFSLLTFSSAYSQFGVFIMPSAEVPFTFSSDIKYNLTIGIKGGVLFEFKKLSVGVGIGFHSFKPQKEKIVKQGLLSFKVDEDSYSADSRSCECEYTESFGNVSMVPISVEWSQNIKRTPKYKLYTGINIGARILSYSHKITLTDSIESLLDPYAPYGAKPQLIKGIITTDKTEVKLYLSPKIGLVYNINPHLSIYFECAFNLNATEIIEGSNEGFYFYDNEPGSYVNKLLHTNSNGIGLIYRFVNTQKDNAKNNKPTKWEMG